MTVENKRSNVRYNKINITFPDWMVDENIIPRNMIINLGCASVDNHIPWNDNRLSPNAGMLYLYNIADNFQYCHTHMF